jgi:endonuclease-3
MISSRTVDPVSRDASQRLEERYPAWQTLADAAVDEIKTTIQDVTFPDDKARNVHAALRMIAAQHPDFDLTFLQQMSVPQALCWLERLPGVGRKVAASTLNFSTLKMASFVIDTHILRLLRRFGFVRNKADIAGAYDLMMPMMGDWSAAELSEFHMLMKRLGQTVCRSNQAHCAHCPIGERCKSAR